MSTPEQAALLGIPAVAIGVAAGVEAAGVGGTVIAADAIWTGTSGLLVRMGIKCADKGSKVADSIGYGPLNRGPLPESIVNTFRGGSYTENQVSEATTLFRVHGGTVGQLGQFWTRIAPAGPLQSRMDLGLNSAWGNTATQVTIIRIPAGTTIYEGFAASQGNLLGGGSQVVIQKIDPSWILR